MSGVVVHADCAVAIRKANERAERAEAAIQRVRALHVQDDGYCRDGTYCAECVEPWPCSTVAALDSTDPEPAPKKRPVIECELGVAGDWCALPIGHAGPCNPTRRVSAGTYPDVPAPGRSGEEKPRCTCGHFVDDHDAGECWAEAGPGHHCACSWLESRSDSGLPADGEERK